MTDTPPDPPAGAAGPGDAPRPEETRSLARRVGHWLQGGETSELVASEPFLGAADDADGPLVPGWHIARGWMSALAGWFGRAGRGSGRWFARRWRSTRGRALLAGLVALVVALPTGLGLGLTLGMRDDRDRSSGATGGLQIARLGVMAPLSGDLGNIGTAVRNAVTLAVDEANETGAIPGWKIELVVENDLSRPDGGSAAAEEFTKDQSMIGVVGPLSSTVAQVALPVLDEAGLPVVSPSNSAPALTGQDDPAGSRTRPYKRYFRLSGTDQLQATVGAQYAVSTLQSSRVLVVDGGAGLGLTLADRFATAVSADGADVTATYRVDGTGAADADLNAVEAGVEAIRPDLIYTTTGYAFASALRKRLASDGLTTRVLGTDALVSARYLDTAGPTAEGDVATDLAVPLSRLPSAGAFAAAFLKRWGPVAGGPEQPATPDKTTQAPTPTASSAPSAAASETTAPPAPTPNASDFVGTGPALPTTASTEAQNEAEMIPALAAYAYDSARAILRAAAVVLPGRTQVDESARAAIAARIGGGSFAGVTGQVAFDAFGDRRDPVTVVYAVIDSRFVPRVVDGR